jgi:hypothetical protein
VAERAAAGRVATVVPISASNGTKSENSFSTMLALLRNGSSQKKEFTQSLPTLLI